MRGEASELEFLLKLAHIRPIINYFQGIVIPQLVSNLYAAMATMGVYP